MKYSYLFSHHFIPPCEFGSSCWSSIIGRRIQQTLTSIRLQNTSKLGEEEREREREGEGEKERERERDIVLNFLPKKYALHVHVHVHVHA